MIGADASRREVQRILQFGCERLIGGRARLFGNAPAARIEIETVEPGGIIGQRRVALCLHPRDDRGDVGRHAGRSEEHTSELQSLMRISYAVFCLKKKTYYPKT